MTLQQEVSLQVAKPHSKCCMLPVHTTDEEAHKHRMMLTTCKILPCCMSAGLELLLDMLHQESSQEVSESGLQQGLTAIPWTGEVLLLRPNSNIVL